MIILLNRILKGIFHIYKEKLYTLVIGNENNVQAKIELSFVEITHENYTLVKDLKGKSYLRKFKKMLNMSDYGVFACINGKPIGYGWAKFENSRDYFYVIKDCYLCRFFVTPKFRGLGVYPTLIRELLNIVYREKGIERFFIAVEHDNYPSIRGIEKVGFKFLQENKFVRCCKITLNKFNLENIKNY